MIQSVLNNFGLDVLLRDAIEVALNFVAVIQGNHSLRGQFYLWGNAAQEADTGVGVHIGLQKDVEGGLLLEVSRVEVVIRVKGGQFQDLIGYWPEIQR